MPRTDRAPAVRGTTCTRRAPTSLLTATTTSTSGPPDEVGRDAGIAVADRPTASASSRSAPAARATTASARRCRRARSANDSDLRHLQADPARHDATTGSSCRSPAARSPTPGRPPSRGTAGQCAPVAVADTYSGPPRHRLDRRRAGCPGQRHGRRRRSPDRRPRDNVTHGTLSLSSNGGFTYTPTNGYTGADSFTYRANDGTSNSNTVTVSLTVTAGGGGSGNGVQLNGSSQYIHVRRGTRPRRRDVHHRAVVQADRGRRRHEHRHGRHRERDPAPDQGPRGGRDPGQPEHGLVPGHRRHERPAGGRLRGQRQRRPTTRSPATRS